MVVDCFISQELISCQPLKLQKITENKKLVSSSASCIKACPAILGGFQIQLYHWLDSWSKKTGFNVSDECKKIGGSYQAFATRVANRVPCCILVVVGI